MNATDDLIHAAEIVVPIILFIWGNRQLAKKDGERKHRENQDKLEELVAERKYLPAHDHVEREGPLHSGGIIRRRNGAVR